MLRQRVRGVAAARDERIEQEHATRSEFADQAGEDASEVALGEMRTHFGKYNQLVWASAELDLIVQDIVLE